METLAKDSSMLYTKSRFLPPYRLGFHPYRYPSPLWHGEPSTGMFALRIQLPWLVDSRGMSGSVKSHDGLTRPSTCGILGRTQYELTDQAASVTVA